MSSGASNGESRLLSSATSTPSICYTNLDPRVIAITFWLSKAQSLVAYADEKSDLLSTIQLSLLAMASDPTLSASSRELLTKYLMPAFVSESDSVTLWHIDHEGIQGLIGDTKALGVSKTSNLIWNFDYSAPGTSKAYGNNSYAGNKRDLNFNDASKPIFIGTGTATRIVHLDDTHTQYDGSDAKDFITLSGNGGTKFNIAAGGGDDSVVIPYTIFTDNNSVVNILGGAGNNTYVIQVKDGWTALAGNIHIWDFDPSKDKIVFQTLGSFANPNITETKRTMFYSPYQLSQINPDGSLLLTQNVLTGNAWTTTYIAEKIFKSHYDNSYKGAEHEFSGSGVALIQLDENNYSPSSANNLFQYANAFQTDAQGDVAGDASTGASLILGNILNTQFSQIDTAKDHDFYKVHVTQGNRYTFQMQHDPNKIGDSVLSTSLALRNADGKTAVTDNAGQWFTSQSLNGNTAINFIATQDGDYFLDASAGSNGAATGKYAISAIESNFFTGMDKNSCATGNFTATATQLGYRMTLSSGDYVEMFFDRSNTSAMNISIQNPKGQISKPWSLEASSSSNKISFLAEDAGDYFIVAKDAVAGTHLTVSSTVKDISDSNTSLASLSEGKIVQGAINTSNDHDWFNIYLSPGHIYQFDMKKSSVASALDPNLVLRKSTGEYVGLDASKRPGMNDNLNANDLNAEFVFSPTTAGTYLLDASSMNNTMGNFTLTYRDLSAVGFG